MVSPNGGVAGKKTHDQLNPGGSRVEECERVEGQPRARIIFESGLSRRENSTMRRCHNGDVKDAEPCRQPIKTAMSPCVGRQAVHVLLREMWTRNTQQRYFEMDASFACTTLFLSLFVPTSY